MSKYNRLKYGIQWKLYRIKRNFPWLVHEIKSLLMGKRRYIVQDAGVIAEFFEYSEAPLHEFYADCPYDVKITRVGRFDRNALCK